MGLRFRGLFYIKKATQKSSDRAQYKYGLHKIDYLSLVMLQHVEEVESTMQELQNKVICLQEEKSVLINKLERCKEKLDAQEQSLSLTRDEREELLQVKVNYTMFHPPVVRWG